MPPDNSTPLAPIQVPQSKGRNAVIPVVGGGLAGTECALQLARLGHSVELIEMRGVRNTPAHKTTDLAELVCSNSFGSFAESSAPGLLKQEARKLGSFVLRAAELSQIPAGQALGVDRKLFSSHLENWIKQNPLIQRSTRVVESLETLPRPAVIATGPLTDASLMQDLQKHFGGDFLYFFDAISPVIDADTINREIIFSADRYGKSTPDYLNCPLEKLEYLKLIEHIEKAEKVTPKHFEETPFFEGCMPIEEMVRRGPQTLRFGPLKPVGLMDPRTQRQPYAVVQLRQENQFATAYNMVGFQTRMTYKAQVEVFRQIPGLENAEFLKLGSLHRNLYLHSPKVLSPNLSSNHDPDLFFAGQITGVEGYFESCCIGLVTALHLHAHLTQTEPPVFPVTTAIGALLHSITDTTRTDFKPTNINWGLLPDLSVPVGQKKWDKVLKRQHLRARAESSFPALQLPQVEAPQV